MPHPQKYSKVVPRSLIATQESIQSTATIKPKEHEEAKLESKYNQILLEEKTGKPTPVAEADDDFEKQSIFKDLQGL
jgi:hypothetical protein